MHFEDIFYLPIERLLQPKCIPKMMSGYNKISIKKKRAEDGRGSVFNAIAKNLAKGKCGQDNWPSMEK